MDGDRCIRETGWVRCLSENIFLTEDRLPRQQTMGGASITSAFSLEEAFSNLKKTDHAQAQCFLHATDYV